MTKKVFNEAQFRRRLEEVKRLSTGQELKLILTGGLDDRKKLEAAKLEALHKARNAIIDRIQKEEQAVRAQRLQTFWGWTEIEIEYFGHQKTEIELVGL